MNEHQQETWAGVLLTALMIGRSYWLPGASVTTHATRAPRHAWPRLRPLGINAKQRDVSTLFRTQHLVGF
jgi:hypothetical protein